ncbi:MAG: hypothetical protein V3R58_02575, partial [candidate division NC10 bacterium]
MKTALSVATCIFLSSLPALAQNQPPPEVPPVVTAANATPEFEIVEATIEDIQTAITTKQMTA